MKFRLLPLTLLFSCLSMFSCSKTINIKIINDNEDKGDVVTTSGNYEVGKLIYLEAIPKENYLFTGWYNGNISLSYKNICSFVVPDFDLTITAKFEDFSTQTFSFDLVEDTAHNQSFEISKYHGWIDDDEVIVPSTHYGFPVTKIKEDTFKNKNNIKSIKVPESIIEIGNEAFANCSAKDVYIPATINEKMGTLAFLNFNDTQRIHLSPNSIREDSQKGTVSTTWKWDLNPVAGEANTYIDITPSGDYRRSGSINTKIIADY